LINRERNRIGIKHGDKYGRLTVIKLIGSNKNKRLVWECLCECNKTVKATGNNLKRNNVKSCGCLAKELNKTKHIGNKPCKTNKLGIRGVCLSSKSKRYQASLQTNGKTYHLGTYDTIEEAASIYDLAAHILWGPNAYLNYPDILINTPIACDISSRAPL